jgi:hypothetical protein
MIKIIAFTIFSAVILAALVECNCRLQIRIITKPRTVANLIKHYVPLLPMMLLIVFFYRQLRIFTPSLEISELFRALLEFGLVVVAILPIIYIVDCRYPTLLKDMENWRAKNT